MGFSKTLRENRISYNNLEESAAITQIQFIKNLLGVSRLEIQTENEEIVSLFAKKGGTSKDGVVWIESLSKELITELLLEAFQIAGLDLVSLRKICSELDVPEPCLAEPYSVVAERGFFGGGAGAGAGESASASRTHPSFQVRDFLHDVAEGRQDEAKALLTATPANTQILLRTPGLFTDYSGRTFNCTAYEYAYWAKDTHMCRMLERQMSEETKAAMSERIDAIEAVGLSYEQRGAVVEHSKHFDFSPLKTALDNYVRGCDGWAAARNWDAIKIAWMAVGVAQRDMPVHVVNEYCWPDRPFSPLPTFNEDTLPRTITFYKYMTRDVPLFPLVVSDSAGLGVEFALIRAGSREAAVLRGESRGAGSRPLPGWCAMDLAAISRLDEVRTADLTLSRKNLKPPVSAPGMSM